MIRKFCAGLFLASFIAAAVPAEAGGFFQRTKGGPSAAAPAVPNVLPGAGPVNTTFNSITPTSHGSPSDFGYSLRGLIRWDGYNLQEIGRAGVSVTKRIGLFAAHTPTDVELLAGLGSNICSVDMRADKGSWFTITAPSANPDAGNTIDWGANFTNANYSDGVHQVDAVAHPCTGPDSIAEGPLSDQWGHGYETVKARLSAINNGSSGAGHIFTITDFPTPPLFTFYNWNGTQENAAAVSVGQSISMLGVAPNTFIDGDAATNATACVAETGSNCTGAGLAGTYHVTGSSQLVAANPAIIGTARSFYFITNFNNTLKRPVIYQSLAGSDGATGLNSTIPVLTYGKAISQVSANGDGHGGTVCLMNGSTYAPTGAVSVPSTNFGWLSTQSADKPPCSAAGDPGGASLGPFDNSSRSYFADHMEWRYVNFAGGVPPTTLSGGSAWYLVADHVTSTTMLGFNGGLLGTGGYACVESTLYFGTDGSCSGAVLSRNNVGKYYVADGAHDIPVVVGFNSDYGGPQFFWATGNSAIGDNVIRNVTLLPSELAGRTLSSIFTGLTAATLWQPGVLETNCFPGTQTVTAIDDAAKTITLSAAATANCTAGNLGSPGAHSDAYQTAQTSTNPQSDLYVAYNNFGLVSPGIQQGFFIETEKVSGFYSGHNYWAIHPLTTERILADNGGNELGMFEANTYNSNKTFSANIDAPSSNETYANDICTIGGPFIPNGKNTRANAPGSSACYTSSLEKCTALPTIIQTGTGAGSVLSVTANATFSTSPSGHTYGWYRNNTETLNQAGNGTHTVTSGDMLNPSTGLPFQFYFVDQVTSTAGPAFCSSMPLVLQ